MPACNEKQADFIVGARVLEIPAARRPVSGRERGENEIVILPGVPSEMKEIFDNRVFPVLRERAGGRRRPAPGPAHRREWGSRPSRSSSRPSTAKWKDDPVTILAAPGEVAAPPRRPRRAGRAPTRASPRWRSRLPATFSGDRIYGQDGEDLAAVVGPAPERVGPTTRPRRVLHGRARVLDAHRTCRARVGISSAPSSRTRTRRRKTFWASAGNAPRRTARSRPRPRPRWRGGARRASTPTSPSRRSRASRGPTAARRRSRSARYSSRSPNGRGRVGEEAALRRRPLRDPPGVRDVQRSSFSAAICPEPSRRHEGVSRRPAGSGLGRARAGPRREPPAPSCRTPPGRGPRRGT